MPAVTHIELTEAGRYRRHGANRLRLLRFTLLAAFLAASAISPLYVFVVLAMPSVLPTMVSSPYLLPFSFAAMALGIIFILYLMAAVLAQRKQLVLYLRHFRVSRAAHNMAAVLRVRFNGHCRLVTLDDSTFRPMDVGRGYKSLRIFIPLAVLTISGAFLAIGVYALLHFAPTMAPVNIIWLSISESLFFLRPFIAGVAWLFTLLLAALIAHFWRVKKKSHLVASDESSLAHVVRRVSELSTYPLRAVIAAPQATVVKTADAIWQATVRQLAACANAAIVDVTKVTPNVLWELDFLRIHHPRLTVTFIADAETYDPTALPPAINVLLYTCDPAGVRRLRQNLRNALDNAPAIPRPTDSPAQLLKHTATAAPFYLILLVTISWAFTLFGYQLQRLAR
jgi:hypothetical protein